MTRNPVTVRADSPALEAAGVLSGRRIDEAPVLNGSGEPIGLLDIQDLLALGILQ
jgi:CBS domain-containing protein